MAIQRQSDYFHRRSVIAQTPVGAFEAKERLVASEIRAGARTLSPPLVSQEAAAYMFWQAWGYVVSVDRFYEQDHWINWLRRLGFTSNTGYSAPGQTTRLYRGAPSGF